MEFSEVSAVVVLFAASVVSAVIAASAKLSAKILPRVQKLALAVAFAAAAFLVQVSDVLKGQS